MSMRSREIVVTVNGKVDRRAIPVRLTLADYLREYLGLTGTHLGCEHGVCGCCTVLVDGDPVRSCLMFAVQVDGRQVVTVEGLAPDGEGLSVLQEAFWETHGLQCGYCTPGMLLAAHALLQENPTPTDGDIREALGGNLCRCTGYQQIVEAVRLAAAKMVRNPAPKKGGRA